MSKNNITDYQKKSHLFPDLEIIRQEIEKIHKKFQNSKGEI